MLYVSETVKNDFKIRLDKVLDLINCYSINFIEVGLFGSYARENYKSTSDIDICIITEHRPDRKISGLLREDAELLGVDIIYISPEYFKEDQSNFGQNLRKDYRRIL